MQGGGSKRSTVERVKPNVSKDVQPDLQQPNRVYEEFIASQIQGTVILPKVCYDIIYCIVLFILLLNVS